MTSTQKQIVLAGKIILFGLLTWFFLYRLFYIGWNKSSLILTILGLLFWGSSICLGALLIEKKVVLYSGFGLSLFSFFIFFHGAEVGPGQFRVALYYFIIMALIFLTFLIYRKLVQREKKMRIKMNFWRIFRRGLPLILTAICLLVTLAYYFSPALGINLTKTELQVPRKLFDKIIKPFESLIQSRLPESAVENKDVNDVLYEWVNSQIESTDASSNKYIPIVVAIGLFFSLKILTIILVPVMVLFSCFIIRVLISIGWVKIAAKSIEVERIEI